jgi:tRNA (cmo5U34)-methyltransferase
MSDFGQTRWAGPAFSREYLDNVDHYIPDRFHLFNVLRSFFRAFGGRPGAAQARVCDLGCGDGILTDQLLREAPAIETTLVDGSPEMFDAAKRRLAGRPNVQFVQQGFDEVLRDSTRLGRFHFVMSSFAIHHLDGDARRALFAAILRQLEPEGCFMNIEAVLPDHAAFTEWFYDLWQEWVICRGQMLGLGGKFHDVLKRARENPDNQYSPLGEQLADLTAAGFDDVECHCKNGVFAEESNHSAGGSRAVRIGDN